MTDGGKWRARIDGLGSDNASGARFLGQFTETKPSCRRQSGLRVSTDKNAHVYKGTDYLLRMVIEDSEVTLVRRFHAHIEDGAVDRSEIAMAAIMSELGGATGVDWVVPGERCRIERDAPEDTYRCVMRVLRRL